MKPATPLPWNKAMFVNGDYTGLHADAAYGVHAANSYPKLVDHIKGLLGLVQLLNIANENRTAFTNHRYVDAQALLRDLGEL